MHGEVWNLGYRLAADVHRKGYATELAFYVNPRPSERSKLQPGAEHGLPVGRVVAAAEKSLPGFKSMYDELSAMAHPSGGGGAGATPVNPD